MNFTGTTVAPFNYSDSPLFMHSRMISRGQDNALKALSNKSTQEGFLCRHCTFIDVKHPEDTLSVFEGLVTSSEGFFEVMERNRTKIENIYLK